MGSKGAALSIQSLSQTDILRVQRLRYITVETTFEVCLMFFIVTIYSSTSQPQLLIQEQAHALSVPVGGHVPALGKRRWCGSEVELENVKNTQKEGTELRPYPLLKCFSRFLVRPLNLCVS